MNLQTFIEGDGMQEFLGAMKRDWEEEMLEEAMNEGDLRQPSLDREFIQSKRIGVCESY
jgi:hypothetical protein